MRKKESFHGCESQSELCRNFLCHFTFFLSPLLLCSTSLSCHTYTLAYIHILYNNVHIVKRITHRRGGGGTMVTVGEHAKEVINQSHNG
jgi:hypothetical protein